MKKRIEILLIFLLFLGLGTGCSRQSHTGDIPVLLYHSVIPSLGDEDFSMYVSSANFKRDLDYLKEAGYETIGLEDLYRYYSGKKVDLPNKPVVITFDDGYLNNYEYAYPLLREKDMQAVIYTIGWSVGRDNTLDGSRQITPHFNWDQAREMRDSGLIEFGSHTFDLHNTPGASYGYGDQAGLGLGRIQGEDDQTYRNRIRKDLIRSKELMEENLGREVDSIAYPYGEYNDLIIDLVEELGFKTGLITESTEPSRSAFEIRRIGIREDLRVEDILD